MLSPHRRESARAGLIVACLAMLLLSLLATGEGLAPRAQAAAAGSSTITQQWLDQMLTQWKPSSNSSLTFQVLDNRVGYGNIGESYNNLAVQTADLNMVMSTNAQCVRMDIGYAPWLQKDQAEISTITTLVQDVRSAGKCLVIADAASETYRGAGKLTWTQFMAAWGPRATQLASLFKPDYYIVVKEPGWYVPMVSDATTNPQFSNATAWIDLTKALAADVQSVSPETKVGASVAADSLGSNPSLYVPYLNGVDRLANISFIGFDIYTTTGFTSTQNFLSQNGSGGKAVWIAEAWSGDGVTVPVFDPTRAQLDKEWALVTYYFAETIHASALMPFFTDCFASYSLNGTSPTDPTQIVALYSQRTPVFSEFQAIIASPAAVTGSSSSTASVTSTASSSSQLVSSSASVPTSSASASLSTSSRQSSSSQQSPSQTFTALGTPPPSAKGLSKGVIIGAVLLVIVILVVAIYLLARRK
jgi:hypothetical protein